MARSCPWTLTRPLWPFAQGTSRKLPVTFPPALFTVFSVWSDSLVFPAYFATISVLTALLYLISNIRLVRNAFDRLFISEQVDHETSILHDPLSSATGGGLCSNIYQHAKSLGGFGIFVFRLTRLLSCLVLLILEVILLLFEKHDWRFTSYGEYWLPRYHNVLPSMFTYKEWLHVAMCITYVIYCLCLVHSIINHCY